MTTSEGPAPGFAKHPDHVVRISPSDNRWTVRIGDTVVADSRGALLLEESGYEPVVYFPPEDVAADRLSSIDRLTTCPFKGEAHYFSDAARNTDAAVAWTYPSVYDEVSAIAGYISFYADRSEIETQPENPD